ncbi:MAG: flagellar basal body-associated FliL family protein [Oscillospiraceae bacterium]|jgi:flagellar basal body-associated protein FliL|nr:flagellar basal body-associated FliL family protein [Oscillospiraceae bacterium]
MKKLLPLILILLCFALLASCGKKEEPVEDDEDEEEEVVVTFPYSTGETFTTNLAPSEKVTHVIRADITLQLKSQKFLDNLTGAAEEAAGGEHGGGEEAGGGAGAANLLVVRDTITFVLRNTTAEQIIAGDSDGQLALREKIVAALNEKFATKSFVGVTFANFVIS